MAIQELAQSLLKAFVAKDLPRIMSHFADDAVLIDPHYPQSRMQGRPAIQQGLSWGLNNIVKPGFTMRSLVATGDTAAIEVYTHHTFRGGMVVRFDQVFMLETRDGQITRLQAYLPHGPHGIAALLTTITRWVWRLTGRLKKPVVQPASGPRRSAARRSANASSFGTSIFAIDRRAGERSDPSIGRRWNDQLKLKQR